MRTTDEIAGIISELLDNEERRNTIGRNARMQIEENFSIDRMGAEFNRLYLEIRRMIRNFIHRKLICKLSRFNFGREN